MGENLRDMSRICGGDSEKKIHMLMEYAGRPGNVVDPWYIRGFDAAWLDVKEVCRGLLEELMQSR